MANQIFHHTSPMGKPLKCLSQTCNGAKPLISAFDTVTVTTNRMVG